jgi:hypothetical protein
MPNTYEQVFNCHDLAGNFFVNVFHYSLSESGTHTPFEYAQALNSAVVSDPRYGDYLAILAPDAFVDFITAKRITGTGGPSATNIRNEAGTSGTQSTSIAYAADIQWQSGAASNRPGHTFIAPMPGDSMVASVFQAGYKILVDTFITDMLVQLTLGGTAGTADFGHFTRKTKVFDKNTSGNLRPKVTALNKRTLPLI